MGDLLKLGALTATQKLAVSLLGIFALSACGPSNAETRTEEAAVQGEPSPVSDRPLPTVEVQLPNSTSTTGRVLVPSLGEKFPELIDEEGCFISRALPAFDDLSEEEATAVRRQLPASVLQKLDRRDGRGSDAAIDLSPAEIAAIDNALEEIRQTTTTCDLPSEDADVATTREILGYRGESFSTNDIEKPPAEPSVLTETISAQRNPDGSIQVLGLVRNGKHPTSLEITAGTPNSQKIQATVFVPSLRPGETSPFALNIRAQAINVDDLSFEVSESGEPTRSRLLELNEEFRRDSYVLFLQSWADDPLTDLSIVVAYFDDLGGVIKVVTQPDEGDGQGTINKEGQRGFFYYEPLPNRSEVWAYAS